MDIKQFTEQRTMTIRELFENRFPFRELHQDCERVYMYDNGLIIQYLTDGTYYTDLFDAQESDEVSTKVKCNSLKMCEEILFKEKSYQHSQK
jgi:hypothetical protein